VMLNEQGGVIDDLIVYFMAPGYFRIVANAGCRDKDFTWLQEQAKPFDVQLEQNTQVAMIALQGPLFAEVLAKVFPNLAAALPQKAFTFVVQDDIFIARTGYTGEAGIEVILPNAKAGEFWEKLVAQGAQQIGLGARDTLRLEAGLDLYGHEMDETVSPWQANLAWTLSFSERDFIGKAALLKEKEQGIAKQLVGIILPQGGILRAEQILETNLGEGIITSGTFSPFLKVAIGMGRVPVGCAPDIRVRIRDKTWPARCVALPFVKKGKISSDIAEVKNNGTYSI
jgi:aminomethyltransferase